MSLKVRLSLTHKGGTLVQSGGASGAFDLPYLRESYIIPDKTVEVRDFSASHIRRGLVSSAATLAVSAPSPTFNSVNAVAIKALVWPDYDASSDDLTGAHSLYFGLNSTELDFIIRPGHTFLIEPRDDIAQFYVKAVVSGATVPFQHIWWGTN